MDMIPEDTTSQQPQRSRSNSLKKESLAPTPGTNNNELQLSCISDNSDTVSTDENANLIQLSPEVSTKNMSAAEQKETANFALILEPTTEPSVKLPSEKDSIASRRDEPTQLRADLP